MVTIVTLLSLQNLSDLIHVRVSSGFVGLAANHLIFDSFGMNLNIVTGFTMMLKLLFQN